MRWVKKPIAAQMKRAQTNMTYVVDGNKCANIVPQGQYFQLINSTIAGRSDGVYTASKVIPANEVIDNTYFNQTSPIAEGAINKINSELTSLNSNMSTETITLSNITISTGTADGNLAGYKILDLFNIRIIVRGVTIANQASFGKIEDSRLRPRTNVYLKVYDYTTAKPINGSLYLNAAGILTYYGDQLSNKEIMIHDCFAVNG